MMSAFFFLSFSISAIIELFIYIKELNNLVISLRLTGSCVTEEDYQMQKFQRRTWNCDVRQ
jgi:hypothetical protein